MRSDILEGSLVSGPAEISGGGDLPIETIDLEKCNGCGYCHDICPMDVIRIDGNSPVIVYVEDCTACSKCEQNCPTNAIFVSLSRRERPFVAWL